MLPCGRVRGLLPFCGKTRDTLCNAAAMPNLEPIPPQRLAATYKRFTRFPHLLISVPGCIQRRGRSAIFTACHNVAARASCNDGRFCGFCNNIAAGFCITLVLSKCPDRIFTIRHTGGERLIFNDLHVDDHELKLSGARQRRSSGATSYIDAFSLSLVHPTDGILQQLPKCQRDDR